MDNAEAAHGEIAPPEPVPRADVDAGAAKEQAAEGAEPAGSVRDDGEGSGRGAPAWMWAVLAVLAVVTLGASLVAANATADRDRDRMDRQAVEEVAGRLATALSTYDYRDFEATKRRVLAMSTGAFASEYERAVGALASIIDQTKATSEATAVDVFVGNLGDGKASAIVVLEIRASGVGGPRVSVDNYVDLSLVKVEGEWRVDGVRNLNLGVAGGGAATPPAARPEPGGPAPSTAP